MYEKLVVSIIVIVLIILILLFLALDTKRTVGQQVSNIITTNVQPNIVNPINLQPNNVNPTNVQPTVNTSTSKVSIETITVANPPTITRLASTAMNLQLKVLGSSRNRSTTEIGGFLTIPALANSKDRIIFIRNESVFPLLQVYSIDPQVIFPTVLMDEGRQLNFKAIRDNEYILL